MSLKLDMDKSAGKLRLSLEKAGLSAMPQLELAVDLDVSGSFNGEHRNGTTQLFLQRFMPWGMTFDPDGKMDFFTFSDGPTHAHYIGEVTPDNCEGYIRNNVIDRVPGYNGGTDYSYVLEKNLQHFGWAPTKGTKGTKPAEAVVKGKPGFLSRLFGHKQESSLGSLLVADNPPAVAHARRSLVIFGTDGQCSNTDLQRTINVLAESEQRNDQIYFLLFGIGGSHHEDFPFLNQIAERFGNTGLLTIGNIRQFVRMDDDELNDLILNNEGGELVKWMGEK